MNRKFQHMAHATCLSEKLQSMYFCESNSEGFLNSSPYFLVSGSESLLVQLKDSSQFYIPVVSGLTEGQHHVGETACNAVKRRKRIGSVKGRRRGIAGSSAATTWDTHLLRLWQQQFSIDQMVMFTGKTFIWDWIYVWMPEMTSNHFATDRNTEVDWSPIWVKLPQLGRWVKSSATPGPKRLWGRCHTPSLATGSQRLPQSFQCFLMFLRSCQCMSKNCRSHWCCAARDQCWCLQAP